MPLPSSPHVLLSSLVSHFEKNGQSRVRVPAFIPMHTTSITAWDRGATSMNVLVTVVVNRLGMTTADGFHAVHVNTMEGFWSLLRSWRRPHRGISQDNVPLYVGFFEFVHTVRRRGKALLGARLALLLT
jgi:hypothetical protein